MTLIDRETLSILNPIFKISRVQILWDDEVNEIEKNGDTHKRICLISTTGIYIIKKKSFPHPAKITSSIIISDLSSIAVIDDKCTFMSSRTQISIQHKNACMFASVVYCVRKAQYPLSILPLSTTLPNDDSFELINENSPYQPSSLFIDRVITCALHLKLDLQQSLIQQIQADLKINENTFIITKSISKSPLFEAIMISIPYALEIRTIIIDNCQLSVVFHHFNEILLRGQQVTKIEFINCDFTNSLSYFKQGITTNGLFKPSIWSFNSTLINESFSSLFDSLTLLNCDIKSLTFDNCTFSNETMSAVFQSIFFNSCFHHLEHFALNGTTQFYDLPFQIASLACCSWVMLSKCLHSISLSNCGIDASSCIPQLLKFDTGLTNLSFSGSNFNNPLVFKTPPVLNHLIFLDLSNSSFTVESLISIFNIINDHLLTIDGLDLSQIQFSDDNQKTTFLEKIENLTVDELKTLVFDDNVLEEKQTCSFASFISKQKCLKHLIINNSIQVSDSSEGIISLINAIKNLDLVTLSLRSDKSSSFSFGSILTKELLSLLSKKTLKYVDLTCQCISNEGLQILKENLNNGIEYLYFDGSNSSIDSLFDFCEAVISSKLKFASYPSMDFTREIEKLKTNNNENNSDSSGKVGIIINRENRLLTRFNNRFPLKPDERFWLEQVNEVKPITQKAAKSSINDNSIPSLSNFSIAPFFNDSVVKRDIEMELLFKEAIDTEADDFREAIYKFVDQIDNQLSFRNLMNNY